MLCALAFAMLAVACGGENPRPRAASGDEPSATPTRDPGPPCTNEATQEAEWDNPDRELPDEESHCRLRRALLTKADLPGRWGTAPFSSYESRRMYEVGVSECATEFPDTIAGLESNYTRSDVDEVTAVWHQVVAVKAGAGERIMAALRRNCLLQAEPDEDGAPSNVGNVIIDASGDRITFTFTLSGVVAYNTVVRDHDVISLLTVVDEQLADGSALAELIEERLKLVGPIQEEPVDGLGCAPEPTAVPSADAEVLQEALLVLDDMPVGWVEDPPEPCGLLNVESDCEAGVSPAPDASAVSQFRGRDRALRHYVGLFDGEDDAEEMVDGWSQLLDETPQCSQNVGESESWEHTWHRVGGSPFGEDALVWLRTADDSSSLDPLVFLGVLVRDGETVASLQVQSLELNWEFAEFGRIRAGEKLNQHVVEEMTPLVDEMRTKLRAIQPELD